MDKQDKEYFEGIIVKAVQSTKQENSGLMGDIKTNIAILKEHYDGIKKTLEEIKIQTTKTNGSVINLRLRGSWMAGGLGIITLLVLPLICYIFFSTVQHIQAQINSLRQTIHEKYEVPNQISS